MYTVLAKEVADIDKALFRKVGRFIPGGYEDVPLLQVLPVVDQIFAAKSMRLHEIDPESDSQHSLLITIESQGDSDGVWMEPGILYRHTRNRKEFIELRHEEPLGVINIIMYFLVPYEDCEFAFLQENGCYARTNFEELRKLGYFLYG